MTTPSSHMHPRTHSATSMLASLLTGIAFTHRNAGADTPDFSASSIQEKAPGVVEAVIHLPSDDTYRVTVEWVSEASP